MYGAGVGVVEGDGESAGIAESLGVTEGRSLGVGAVVGEGDGVSVASSAASEWSGDAYGLVAAVPRPTPTIATIARATSATAIAADVLRRGDVRMAPAWYRQYRPDDPHPMVLVRSWHMGSKLAIGTGLLAGILVGGLAVGAAVALLPPPPAPVIATPSPLVAATPTPAPTAAPSPSVSATPTARPSGAASPTSSGSASGAQSFGIGQSAPNLKLTKAGGGTLNPLDLRGKAVRVNFMAT